MLGRAGVRARFTFNKGGTMAPADDIEPAMLEDEADEADEAEYQRLAYVASRLDGRKI